MVVNGTPLMVRSDGYCSVTCWLPTPDAARAALAFATSCLIASFCGSEPRNIDGMSPGAWIAPGPATDRIDLYSSAHRTACCHCLFEVTDETFGSLFANSQNTQVEGCSETWSFEFPCRPVAWRA